MRFKCRPKGNFGFVQDLVGSHLEQLKTKDCILMETTMVKDCYTSFAVEKHIADIKRAFRRGRVSRETICRGWRAAVIGQRLEPSMSRARIGVACEIIFPSESSSNIRRFLNLADEERCCAEGELARRTLLSARLRLPLNFGFPTRVGAVDLPASFSCR